MLEDIRTRIHTSLKACLHSPRVLTTPYCLSLMITHIACRQSFHIHLQQKQNQNMGHNLENDSGT